MYKAILCVICLFSTTFGYSAKAGNLGFEKNEEAILQKLIAPTKNDKPMFKTRGINSAPLKRTFKVRGLTVVERQTGLTDTVEKNIEVPIKRSGGFVNLEVRFDVNSAVIRPESINTLDQLATALARQELNSKSFFINGHTDTDGSDDYNLELSLKRAISVRKYLTYNHSIPLSKLKIMGYGEGIPLVENTTVSNKQINRRVEIVSIEK